MDWFRPEKTTRDANQESSQNQDSSNDRPGKFSDLAEFMNIKDDYRPKAVRGLLAPIDPGDIVYIKDPSGQYTRINDRVVLVLYHSQPSSYQCLSFCRHPDFSGETLHSSHAVVSMIQASGSSPIVPRAVPVGANLPHLEICLTSATSLQPNIYLNLREHWTIEKEVKFVTLGRGDPTSYDRLRPEIENQFSRALKGLDNNSVGRPPPPSRGQEAMRPEDRHGKRRNTVYRVNERIGREDGADYVTTERKRHSGHIWPISRSYQRG